MRGWALALAVWLSAGAAQGQTLVIVGGGLNRDNAAVYGAFIDALPTSDAMIVIVSAASIEPAASAASAREAFALHGVAAARVVTAPLAVVDDPSTTGVNESEWGANGASTEVAAQVASAGGIWFTGGDQTRIMAVLGAEGSVLAAMGELLRRGGVIGGTSAGAAIMSQRMIARGDPVAALSLPILGEDADDAALDSGALALRRGAGFFGFGLVDQHFDRSMRLGRLVRALSLAPRGERLGFGIDEDTAMVVDVVGARMRVVGAGAVTVVDARRAWFGVERFGARDVTLSVLNAGDGFDLVAFSVRLAPGRVAKAKGGAADAVNSGLSAFLLARLAADSEEEVERLDHGVGARVRYAFKPDRRTRLWRDGAGAPAAITDLPLSIN